MRFPQRTSIDSSILADTSRACVDYVLYTRPVPAHRSTRGFPSTFSSLSNLQIPKFYEPNDRLIDGYKYATAVDAVLNANPQKSMYLSDPTEVNSDLEDENPEAAHMFDEMPNGVLEDNFSVTPASPNTDGTNSGMIDDNSYNNDSALQSHYETLQTEVTVATFDNTIGNSSNFVPITSLEVTGYNLVVNSQLDSKHEDEENSQDDVALSNNTPQRDASGFLVPFDKQGAMMSNACSRLSEIEYLFTDTFWLRSFPSWYNSLEVFHRVNQNGVSPYLDFSLHKCNWVDTGQECDLPSSLSSNTRRCDSEETIQEGVTVLPAGSELDLNNAKSEEVAESEIAFDLKNGNSTPNMAHVFDECSHRDTSALHTCVSDEGQVFDIFSHKVEKNFPKLSHTFDVVENIDSIHNNNFVSALAFCENPRLIIGACELPLVIEDGKGNVTINKDEEKSNTVTGYVFEVFSYGPGHSLVENEVFKSLEESSDLLSLDDDLMHDHISIHLPFDPGESIPPQTSFERGLQQFIMLSRYASNSLSLGTKVVDIPRIDSVASMFEQIAYPDVVILYVFNSYLFEDEVGGSVGSLSVMLYCFVQKNLVVQYFNCATLLDGSLVDLNHPGSGRSMQMLELLLVGLDFPFDPGSGMLTLVCRISLHSEYCRTSRIKSWNAQFIASTMWNACLAPLFKLSILVVVCTWEPVSSSKYVLMEIIINDLYAPCAFKVGARGTLTPPVCDITVSPIMVLGTIVDGESLIMNSKVFSMFTLYQQKVLMNYDLSKGKSQSGTVLFVGGSSLYAWQCAGPLQIPPEVLILQVVSKMGTMENFNVYALALICPKEIFDSNLEDKVLIEGGSIVVNGVGSVRAYGLELVIKTDAIKIVGPRKRLESFIWDPGPLSNGLKKD